MTFTIPYKTRYRSIVLKVKHIPIDTITEHFKVTFDGRYILLESNRPFFRNKGLKHRTPNFKLIDGSVRYASNLDVIIEGIMNKFEPPLKKE